MEQEDVLTATARLWRPLEELRRPRYQRRRVHLEEVTNPSLSWPFSAVRV
jgi:hypothetical protein